MQEVGANGQEAWIPENKMHTILIPAKNLSTRVPSKNFRPFHQGRSLVNLATELALSLQEKIRIIVSTDNPDFQPHSSRVQLHRRPPSLALTLTPIHEVILDVAREFDIANDSQIILLQPTSPFRTVEDLKCFVGRVEELKSGQQDYCIVSTYQVEDTHPGRMYSINDCGQLTAYDPTLETLQSQELPACFHRNGCFYMFSMRSILRGHLYSEKTYNFQMPNSSSINIDTVVDFKIAQAVYPAFLERTLEVLKPV